MFNISRCYSSKAKKSSSYIKATVVYSCSKVINRLRENKSGLRRDIWHYIEIELATIQSFYIFFHKEDTGSRLRSIYSYTNDLCNIFVIWTLGQVNVYLIFKVHSQIIIIIYYTFFRLKLKIKNRLKWLG